MDIHVIRRYLKGKLNEENIERLKRFQALRFRRTQHLIFRILFGRNLKALSVVNHSDKWGYHFYAAIYERYFARYRSGAPIFLEIGIGGYDDPRVGGGSLRMWRTYFPRGKIFGIDIFDKKLHDEARIKTFQGSQVDPDFLASVLQVCGAPDIILDDGSHINEHVITSFELLFPHLKPGGLYVVEDTQTAYDEIKGGSSSDLQSPRTSMGYFKRLVDSVNYQEISGRRDNPCLGDGEIIGIHFFHSLIIIEKGNNNEPASNQFKE